MGGGAGRHLGLGLLLASCGGGTPATPPPPVEASLVSSRITAGDLVGARALLPRVPEASQGLLPCELRRAEGDPAGAAACALRLADASADPHDALFFAASAYEAASLPAEALAAFRRALTTPPANPFEALAVARLEAALGRPADALATVEAALGDHPDHPDLNVRRAHLLGQLGRAGEGIPVIDHLLAVDGTHLGARLERICLALAAGDTPRAVALADALEGDTPDEPEVALAAAQAHLAAGDPAGAAARVTAGLEDAGDCACTAEVRAALGALQRRLPPGTP